VDLALLALADPRRNIGTIATLVVLDVLMILTGLLAGSTESGAGRGFWFIVSTILFVAPIFLLVTQLFAAARNASGSAQGPFNTLAYLTVVLWSLYPIVWLLGTEGFGAIGTGSEVFLFLMLDFLAKIAFGILLLTNRQALVEATGGGAAARPSRVR
jgi:bacteriorhodopsin